MERGGIPNNAKRSGCVVKDCGKTFVRETDICPCLMASNWKGLTKFTTGGVLDETEDGKDA